MAATVTKETDGTFSVNMAGDSTISLATENTYLDKNIVFNIADSNYATQTWVGNNYQPKGTYLTAHQSLSGYATQTWVQNQGYLTSHQSLTDYATKSWCNTTFQPKGTYLTEHQSLSGYATQTWVQNQKYLTSHQSLSGYATTTWCNSTFQPKGTYLTAHQSLTNYLTKDTTQSGMVTTSNLNGYFRTYDITFSKPFSSTPVVVACLNWANAWDYIQTIVNCGVYNVTKTGCKIWVGANNGNLANYSVTVNWIAFLK